jgi:exopolysaccharide biosynthesis operon protein EpsL
MAILVRYRCDGGNDICMMGTSVNAKNLRRFGATLATRSCAVGLAVSLALSAQNAKALGSDTVFISGSAGVTYDNNFFRLDSGVDPQNGSSHRDDTIFDVGLGLRADVPYSRQRFQANLNINEHKYSRFTYLDYLGISGRGAWLWQVGDDFSGDVGVSVSQSLQNYSYTTVNTQRNVVRYINTFFDPTYRIAPNLELQGGLSYLTARNTLATADVNDLNQTSARLGLGYVTRSQSRIGLQVETSSAKFPNNTFNNDYRDRRVATFYNWQLTGASHIDGSFGYKQRHHDVVTQRDFSGWTGSVGWNWVPTGRTSFRFAFSRDVGGVEDLIITYARTYTLSASPSYQLTSKISLNGTAQYQDLRFFGNTGFVTTTTTGTLADRHDKTASLGLGASYLVTRIFSLGLNYRWERRSSNVALGSYSDNIISLSGNLTF